MSNAVVGLTRQHPLLLDWADLLAGEYDPTAWDSWADSVTTAAVTEFCSEQLEVSKKYKSGLHIVKIEPLNTILSYYARRLWAGESQDVRTTCLCWRDSPARPAWTSCPSRRSTHSLPGTCRSSSRQTSWAYRCTVVP